MQYAFYAAPAIALLALSGAEALLAGDDGAPVAGGGPECAARPLSVVAREVTVEADGARSVSTGDLDGDEDLDIVSASANDDTIAWYENDGGAPPAFTPHVIDAAADLAQSVFAVDLDGDLDVDVVAASGQDNTVAWYDNDGGILPSFTKRVITSSALNAVSVHAADVDGDGNMDVVAASQSDATVSWFESDGGTPPTFAEHELTTSAGSVASVFAFDIDDDDDVDVVAAYGSFLEWWENDGLMPPTFTARIASNELSFAQSVYGADLDNDLDGDLVASSLFDNTVAWFENDGADPPAFTRRVVVTDAGFPVGVHARDLDGDSNVDLLSASFSNDRIDWYQSDGGSPPAFTRFPVNTKTNEAQSVVTGDLDGDLDPDVVSASLGDDKVAWFELKEPSFGICCLEDGTCIDTVCLAECAAVQAWAWEPDVTCAEYTCPGGSAPAAFLVDELSEANFRATIADLAAFGTRYWDREGNTLAVEYLRDALLSYGYDNVVLDPYDFAGVTQHNVYATKMGSARPTEMYVLGAHLDSFNDTGQLDDAPGADDDASGCASVLEMARVFASAETDVSVRFVLWNNEETGLDGSRAYVAAHRELQGTLDEPTWLAMIQQDMIMWDYGPGKVPDADVEYQQDSAADGLAVILGAFVSGAMGRYGELPSELSGNMRNTDSVSFMDDTVAISVRENTRDEIGDGSNPHWHRPSDNPSTYGDRDYNHGFNICKMIAGAVGELVGARPAACVADVTGDDVVDTADLLAVLASWGPCIGCPADIDGNDVVDTADLLAVLAGWGPCP